MPDKTGLDKDDFIDRTGAVVAKPPTDWSWPGPNATGQMPWLTGQTLEEAILAGVHAKMLSLVAVEDLTITLNIGVRGT